MKLPVQLYKAGKFIGKHAPVMLTAAGVLGLGATSVFAFKAAKKVDGILEEAEKAEEVQTLIEEKANIINNSEERVSDQEFEELSYEIAELEKQLPAKELTRMELGKQIAGAVALPVATGLASITAIVASYYLLNNRVLNLAAALATSTAEAEFRKRRVKEVYGDEGEKAIYGAPTDKVKRTVTGKNGKEKEVEEEVKADRPSLSGEWLSNSQEFAKDDHQYNLSLVNAASNNLETRLFARGYLTLNEVYDALGFPRQRAGAVLGWTSGTNFYIDPEVVEVTDQDTGMVYPDIYVRWPQPKSVYEEIAYTGRYALDSAY